MRPRHQLGSIVKRNGLWLLRYYEDRVQQGKAKRVRVAKILAPVNNTYRVKTHVQPIAEEFLKRVNGNQATQLDGTMTLTEFACNAESTIACRLAEIKVLILSRIVWAISQNSLHCYLATKYQNRGNDAITLSGITAIPVGYVL
jgi:hypothetical protein